MEQDDGGIEGDEAMDDDDNGQRSSSSISSSEWEEGDGGPNDPLANELEADDEQSDWPGAEVRMYKLIQLKVNEPIWSQVNDPDH